MARIVVFVGSVRNNRQGRKVSDWVANRLQNKGHDVSIIDPAEHPELLQLQMMFKSMEKPSEDMVNVHELIKKAHGFVAVTPEYNHSYSGAIKSMMDHFLEEYYFKPFAIITYSAGGFGGIRAAEHLRCVTAEMGAPSIPISLSISHVQKVFGDNGELTDKSYDERFDRMAREFEWYIEAFNNQRKKGTPY